MRASGREGVIIYLHVLWDADVVNSLCMLTMYYIHITYSIYVLVNQQALKWYPIYPKLFTIPPEGGTVNG